MTFKKTVKMMAEGGHVDVKEDKSLIKKAFKMHDDQLHNKKRTDLSKLCSGGYVKRK
jgi:hypothetical protein